ncbi:MAG: cytochrome c biogenesis protein CcsA [Bacteroidales bacterium]|nr:cytochrome c biogenesis protein CcsA [Bacteroidales bacterium]MBK7175020.1 cytochrome c biogenesis protein CcsA [Bacteroidales bacterium]
MTFKKDWWKFLGLALVLYSVIVGMMMKVPELPLIGESIRNLFYHVVMWFAMMLMFIIGLVSSIRYLSAFDMKYDRLASQAVNVGLLFGILGIVTGMEWAKFTWGTAWTNDPQLNGAAVTILAYFAYLVLRSSLDEDHKRARISAVYNIFAFVLLVVFIGILPRIANNSLHPAAGGNASTMATLDTSLRMVFYPAIIGWVLIGCWIIQIKLRLASIKHRLMESDIQ